MQTKHRAFFAGILILAGLALNGCASMQTMMSKAAVKLLTKKTADLKDVSVTVWFVRNAYPARPKTMMVDYFGKDWQEGRNLVSISFLNRKGAGFLKIDGKVTIDGEEAKYAGLMYYRWFDKNDLKPKRIRVETVSGKTYQFVARPAPSIRLESINGKRRGPVEINVNKPFTLQLKAPKVQRGTQVFVATANKMLAAKEFVDDGLFRYQETLRIPPAMWRHPAATSTIPEGENILRVERAITKTVSVQGVGACQVVGSSYDYMPVILTGKVKAGKFKLSGIDGLTLKISHNGMNAELHKPTAFRAPPLSRGKTFALASFTVRATKLQQSKVTEKQSSKSTNYATGTETTIETTTIETRTFPKLPDIFWEKLVSDLHDRFIAGLKKAYPGITILPIEKTMQARAYGDLIPIKDVNTTVEVVKSYKGSKNLMPTQISELRKDVSMTFANDRPDARLIRELGVDGLIAVTVDLEMPWEEFTLQPKMSFRIIGPPVGSRVGPSVYAQGVISGKGMPMDQAKYNAKYVMDILPNVVRAEDLMRTFEKGLIALQQKEQNSDYTVLWSLR